MKRNDARNRRGAILVLMVILLPVVLLLCAFAINMAYMELNRTEMYVAADAAARAGGKEYAITRSQADAIARAKQFALLNEVAGQPLQLSNSDLVFGSSQRPGLGRYVFSSGGSNPNAVQVTANRSSGSLDGAIPLLMPNLLGSSSFETQQSAISSQSEIDVALVIDRSGSMAYAANEPAVHPPNPSSAPPGWNFCDEAPPICRWRNVVDGVAVFLNECSQTPTNEFVSLTTYSGSAVTDRSLTSDYSQIMSGLAPYTASFCAGGTNIGGGINEGAAALASSPAARDTAIKVIIVLTDGIHNQGSNPVTAASSASSGGALIFTITFSNEAGQSLMQQVATTGGGLHFHANTPSDLITAFQEIGKHLPTLLTE